MRRKLSVCILAIVAVLVCVKAWAEAPVLFKDLRYGMSVEEVKMATGAIATDQKRMLFDVSVPFASYEWMAFYFFDKDKLYKVILAGSGNFELRLAALVDTIIRGKFDLILLEGKSESIDIIAERKTTKKTELKEKIVEFIPTNFSNGYVSAIFVTRLLSFTATSALTVLSGAPKDTRVITIEYDSSVPYTRITFALPLMDEQSSIQQQQRKPAENFLLANK